MIEIFKNLSIKEAKKIAYSLFPIGSAITLFKAETVCPAIVVGYIFFDDGTDFKDDLSYMCKLIVLKGKIRYVAMISESDGEIEIWSSSFDDYFEKDWPSNDWVTELPK